MSALATWGGVTAIVLSATAGDILQASAMREIGDLGVLRRSQSLAAVVRRVATNPRFLLGMIFMTCGFFSLLITLSWADVSVVGPASASLTFVANAIAAHLLLHEHVSRRRWAAVVFVAAGVALLAM